MLIYAQLIRAPVYIQARLKPSN